MKQGTINLYIDESGSGAIYEPPPKNYQYFNMAGVLLSDISEQRLSSELRKWKKKYLMNQYSTFHAVDVFEDFKQNYKNRKLERNSEFYLAAIDLIRVFLSIDYQAQVFYIDLIELRKQLHLDQYIHGKQNILKDIINKEYRAQYLQPISTILENFFLFHESFILRTKRTGYLCFESQRELDEQTIKTFHQTLNIHNKKQKSYKYGQDLLGIHFDTKASLCGALELADFIAYSSTQFLRFEVKSQELQIKTDRLAILLECNRRIKKDRKISLRDCTYECISELKKIHNPQKRASS